MFAYVDPVVKLGLPEHEFIVKVNELIEKCITCIPVFKLFRQALIGYFCSILLLSSETTHESLSYSELTKYQTIKYKGSIITNTPLLFENDILTAKSIIEIKTGMTETKKNMSKLVLENIILTESKVNIPFKNLILFNPRSNVVSFISANSFVEDSEGIRH